MAAAKVIDRDLVMCFECWLCCGPALSCWVCAHSRERGIESSMCLNRVREFESSSFNERPRCQERPHAQTTREHPEPLSAPQMGQSRVWALWPSRIARHSRVAGALDVDPRDFLVKKLQTRFTIAAKA